MPITSAVMGVNRIRLNDNILIPVCPRDKKLLQVSRSCHYRLKGVRLCQPKVNKGMSLVREKKPFSI